MNHKRDTYNQNSTSAFRLFHYNGSGAILHLVSALSPKNEAYNIDHMCKNTWKAPFSTLEKGIRLYASTYINNYEGKKILLKKNAVLLNVYSATRDVRFQDGNMSKP